MKKIFESKSLKSAEYTTGARVLEVEFHTGNIYQYHDVPPEVVDAFYRSDSAGNFFNQHIKDRYLTFRLN